MTAAAEASAREARRAVLRAEYGAQERALVGKEQELETAGSWEEHHRLEMEVAWHRDTLRRLHERLAG